MQSAVCSNKANGNRLWEVHPGLTSAIPVTANESVYQILIILT